VVVTVSLVVLFGLFLALLLRFRQVGAGSAFVAVMFGFFLASTGAGGPISRLAAACVQAVSDLAH
jgi:hypothetical protein